MMDASALYPKGFHPVQLDFLPSMDVFAKCLSRIALLEPIKYYFVDFGLSVYIPADVRPKEALGHNGLDQEVPELSYTKPYDPFKVDMFILGHVLQQKLHAVSASNRAEYMLILTIRPC